MTSNLNVAFTNINIFAERKSERVAKRVSFSKFVNDQTNPVDLHSESTDSETTIQTGKFKRQKHVNTKLKKNNNLCLNMFTDSVAEMSNPPKQANDGLEICMITEKNTEKPKSKKVLMDIVKEIRTKKNNTKDQGM